MSTALILLAAGQGTRMKSDLPKVLHKVAGAPLLIHAMRAGENIAAEKTVVVIGHGGPEVQAAALAYNEDAACVEQAERLGTAHAVAQARPVLDGFDGDAIVMYGDTPFISPDTLEEMLSARAQGEDVIFLGFEAADPGRYGRMIIGPDGALQDIVEYKDANRAQRAINLCNSGVVCANAKTLFSLIDDVGNDNANGEFYLTDIVRIARGRGLRCRMVTCREAETLGVNTRAELAHAEAQFQSAARVNALESGVTLTAPDTVFFAFDTLISADVEVGPYVTFGPEVTIDSGARIHAFCHLEGCHIAKDAVIGPYARLRPGSDIGEAAKVGNFVEVKASHLAKGAKANHLSYIGDTSVGAAANIGAGTITCNYDGVFKHHTTIGERAFIGSNSALVAPVEIGDDALVGSGSVITRDVSAGDLALGRGRQVNKQGLGKRLMDMLRQKKKGKT